MAKDLFDRLWGRVKPDPFTGCWEWEAYKNPKGYGQVGVGSVAKLVHRVTLESVVGELGPGVCSLHTCDNPGCVNPAHLFEGSLADNNQDMVTKGRHCKNGVGMPQERGLVPRGMDHWNAKITPEQAAEIRERIAGGDTGRALAKEYGTSEAVVSLIRNNKWRVSCRKHQKPL